MHFHDSLVQKLLELYSTHGGFTDESRLRSVLRDVKVEATRLPSGEIALVYVKDSGRGPR